MRKRRGMERINSSDRTFSTEDERWQAFVERDPRADGFFFVGVTSTGIYCRPVCKSRLPRREHVRFFDSPDAAEAAGFRACKRCSPRGEGPDEAQRTAILRACARLERADEPLGLAALAAEAGLSPSYFQRLFKRVVGVSPKQYAVQKRTERVRSRLQEEERITDAIFTAGFNSNSSFYSRADASLGMSPAEYKKGGQGLALNFTIVRSYLGWTLVAASEKGICAIDFGDTPEALQERLAQRFPQAKLAKNDVRFAEWVGAVVQFLQRPAEGLDLPLDVQGTAFQRRVWLALRSIPAGETASYTQVAAQIGSPKAVRAVAQACASNRIAVAIPCHRVVRADGALGGYRWGLERKRKLLELERNQAGEKNAEKS
jgi:AraC family transcriptional regulator, regulatory protein of adaptative response / methylated-DNA-[protein]-cysteine methyltransferase